MVVPNGCVPPEEKRLEVIDDAGSDGDILRIGFLASAHQPNVDAAKFVVRELAASLPTARFEIIGSVCAALNGPLPANVALLGVVDERSKTPIMAKWKIGLNPVSSGGGSSVKLPDYMAHNIVTLSTPTGARGFPIVAIDAGQVVDLNEFRDTLIKLANSSDQIARQRLNGRRYAVSELSWPTVTRTYREVLRGLVASHPIQNPRRKLLVVTYRYTEPALGSAEEYLIEILTRLRPRFETIDLAAVDSGPFSDCRHFGCAVSTAHGGATRRLTELFDQALYFCPGEISKAETLARARNIELAWTREECTLLAPFASAIGASGRLRLFGGFLQLDNHNDVEGRWTSPDFSFLLPPQSRAFTMSGCATAEKTLRITLLHLAKNGDSEEVNGYAQRIPSDFSVTIALPGGERDEVRILRCQVEGHQVHDDHRPFGVFIKTASAFLDVNAVMNNDHSVIDSLIVSTADLTDCYDELFRSAQFTQCISAFHRVAALRDPAVDADFKALQAPHAGALQQWLEAHAEEYHCVLVQGLPFDLIPSTVDTLGRLKRSPRVVTLPHFQADNRLHYWKRHFDSFAAADATLVFSPSLAAQVEPSARLVVVPGGGVSGDEHAEIALQSHFRELHQSEKPFFLVLTANTGSQGYVQVTTAYRALRRTGAQIDLIFMGPGNGHEVEGAGIYYLGVQPRVVIRGALSACLGLISMSRSENFATEICEAWLFSKPVIANGECHSFRELITDGESGMLVSTDLELVEAMRYLADRPRERARMGQRGFEEVVANYTWDKVAETCLGAILPPTMSNVDRIHTVTVAERSIVSEFH